MKRNVYKQLIGLKKQLGPIIYRTITADNFADAHYKLGKMMRSQTTISLSKKMTRIQTFKFKKDLLYAEKCRQNLEEKVNRRLLSEKMRSMLKEYTLCFKAWCRGVGIEEKIGFWLQNENICCQTGMVRTSQNSIIAWHTEEEDPSQSYIEKPQIVNFQVKSHAQLTSFIHPFYLPGTGFGWQKNFFHAVNSFYLEYNNEKGGSLASIFSWMIWRLGPDANFKDIFELLSPFIDGYSILYVSKNKDKIEGGIVEFGAHNYSIKKLSENIDEYLFQATVIDPKSSLIGYQNMTKRSKKKYNNRIKRTKVLLSRLFERGENVTMQDILGMMASRWGNGFSYSNKDVKAHVVAEITNKILKISVGSGPALENEHHRVIILQ